MQVWRETGISPEDSKISAPYLQSVQGQDRGYEMQCCGEVRRDNMVKIKPEYIFPLLLILLDVGAAIIYAVQKDYKKAVYWLAAAVLNVTVTF